jgi:hypothetical protein
MNVKFKIPLSSYQSLSHQFQENNLLFPTLHSQTKPPSPLFAEGNCNFGVGGGGIKLQRVHLWRMPEEVDGRERERERERWACAETGRNGGLKTHSDQESNGKVL